MLKNYFLFLIKISVSLYILIHNFNFINTQIFDYQYISLAYSIALVIKKRLIFSIYFHFITINKEKPLKMSYFAKKRHFY